MKDHVKGGMLLNGSISVFNTKKLFYGARNLHLKFTASLIALGKLCNMTCGKHLISFWNSLDFLSAHSISIKLL